MGQGHENEVWLLGLNMSIKPKWLQLLICAGGLFLGFLVNGVCEEYVYNRLKFSYGWYFTFFQGFVYLIIITCQGFGPKQVSNSWRTYVKLSAVLMGSQGLTKGCLMFINYPAQIMFKSTKVLPVMVMGAFIPGLRRRYTLLEYISAILLVIGLILFTLADAQSSPDFSVVGVLMVVSALVLDAFVGNFQEAIFTINPATSQTEMLYCTTLVGLPFLLPPMFLTNEIFKAWSDCYQNPYVYLVLIVEAVATYVGNLCVLSLIALFGAATTAMVTTARKALTLLLSYILFTKPLLGQHCTGLMLIGMGILLKMAPTHLQKRSTKPSLNSQVNSSREDSSFLQPDPEIGALLIRGETKEESERHPHKLVQRF